MSDSTSPVETVNSTETVRFDQFPLAAPILKAIQEVGYETPSPIQEASLPPLLEGKDILGQAQTGTGKTAAFSLPLLSRLDTSAQYPQLLVLAPTRELAIQVAEAMTKYARYLPDFHVLPLYGGQSMGAQLRQLKRGVQVIVGTPGRVLDHLGRGSLDLSRLSAIVLDEADEMLRMGFIDDVDEILSHTPDNCQVALFSATMPEAIRRIALRHLNEPTEIRIKAKTTTVEAIKQHYWTVRGINKLDALTRILEVTDFDAMIIFVRTKTSTEELAERLEARGYASAALNGDLNQQQREKTVERLKEGKIDIIVATDVAARGLDVPRISHVVNYDIPHDIESYVHRIGRTGRAGRKGEAILFVAPREMRMLRAIERATRQNISIMKLPTREDIVGRRVEAFKQTLSDAIEGDSLQFFRELLVEYESETQATTADIAAALAYLVQKEQPLQPNIKDVPDEPERRERDRGDRSGDRGERRGRDRGAPAQGMKRYRLDVGREHGAQARHFVGAIANELNMESRYIQNLDIRQRFTLVDLPDSLDKDALSTLKGVRVSGRKLNLNEDRGPSGGGRRGGGDRPRSDRRGGEGRGGDRSRSDRRGGEGRGYRDDRPRSDRRGGEGRGDRPRSDRRSERHQDDDNRGNRRDDSNDRRSRRDSWQRD